MHDEIVELIKREGWELTGKRESPIILAEGRQFKYNHPALIHLKLYKDETNPELKYIHMKAAHDYLWPDHIYHEWIERCFRTHCAGWTIISYAGGASTTKSFNDAKVDILFWLADPKNRAVIVASTSLESLNSRIWGYVTRFIHSMAIPLKFFYRRGAPPKILYDPRDMIHGMFAVAAKKGDDDVAISNWIGRHPNKGLKITLDEGPDMPIAILGAIPNLSAGQEVFQCTVIGNSNSKFDLHGSMSTPLGEKWSKIDPSKDLQWETTQKNGICLFFPCWDSPAIREKDPAKKAKLSKFLITAEQIEERKKLYGEKSDSYYRFVLGFWRDDGSDDVVMSAKFVEAFNVTKKTEWSGLYPVRLVAGLDPAFSIGGDKCILQVGMVGHDTRGKMVIDFRGGAMRHIIKISPLVNKSAEMQVVDSTLEILNNYGCTLDNLAIDATGQGRGIADLLVLRANSLFNPIRVCSVQFGMQKERNKQINMVVKSTLELWTTIRDYVQHDQVRGVDWIALKQLTSRLIVTSATGRRVLESKSSFRARMGAISVPHSPDEADALALCLQAAILRMGLGLGQTREIPKISSFEISKLDAYRMQKKDEAERAAALRYMPTAEFDSGLEESCAFITGPWTHNN